MTVYFSVDELKFPWMTGGSQDLESIVGVGRMDFLLPSGCWSHEIEGHY